LLGIDRYKTVAGLEIKILAWDRYKTVAGLEIKILAWDRYKTVAGLNQLIDKNIAGYFALGL